MAGDNASDWSKAIRSTSSRSSTRQTWTPRSPALTNCGRRHRGWKTQQAKCTSASWRTSLAAIWAAMAELLADDIVGDDRRRVVNAGLRRGRDTVHRGHEGSRRDRRRDHLSERSLRPAGSALPSLNICSSGLRSVRPGAEMLCIVEIDADERLAARRRVRPRRHRRCLRGTRGSVPRRRSGRLRAHVVGQSRGPPPRSTGTNYPRRRRIGSYIDHRAARSRIDASDLAAAHPCHLGPDAGHHASASRRCID